MSWDNSDSASNSPSVSRTTLWMGELEPWMDENFIRSTWYNLGENVTVKMMRASKFQSGFANFCFVDFATPAAAAQAMQNFNGSFIPGTMNKVFRLNLASGGGLVDRREDRVPEFSVFVGDLAPDVTDVMLMNLFQQHYPSVKSAKVVTDPNTGNPRGYGFVRFNDDGEAQRAMNEMQGQLCGSRPMRLSNATPKAKAQNHNFNDRFNDPNNTTIFVGGLTAQVLDDDLRGLFSSFGEVIYTKVPPNKGCGFVQFTQRHSAEMAIQQMNGYVFQGMKLRLSWGRSLQDKAMDRSRNIHLQHGYYPYPGAGMQGLLGNPGMTPPPAGMGMPATSPNGSLNESYLNSAERHLSNNAINAGMGRFGGMVGAAPPGNGQFYPHPMHPGAGYYPASTPQYMEEQPQPQPQQQQ